MMGAGALAGLSIAPAPQSTQTAQFVEAAGAAPAAVRIATASMTPTAGLTSGEGFSQISEQRIGQRAFGGLQASDRQSVEQQPSDQQPAAQHVNDDPSADQQPPEQVAMLTSSTDEAAAASVPQTDVAEVPLPRKRPAIAPTQEATAGMKLASASATTIDLPRQITHPKKVAQDNGVLNDAQIASVKAKLHLTPDQERYWPGVEAALRRIAWDSKQMAKNKRAVRPSDGPAIDMDGAGVAQLKSAAFPLVMSFTEDQKDEVRKFAHLIGLTKLAQEF